MTLSPDLAALKAGNLKGALLMVLAMFCFSLEDMAVKQAAAHMPVGQILTLFGFAGTMIFAGLTWQRRERVFHPVMAERVMVIRAGFEVLGRVFFTLSLALTALSTTSAILQATPLMVAAAAVVIFREPVSLSRWALIALGFLGVLLVIRPGLDGFSPLSILAVLGMIGFAGRDLATRAASPVLSYAQLGVTGFAALLLSGLLLSVYDGYWIMPQLTDLGYIIMASLVGVAAYTPRLYHHGKPRRCRRLYCAHHGDAHGRAVGRHAVSLHAACLCHGARRAGLWRTARCAGTAGRSGDCGRGCLVDADGQRRTQTHLARRTLKEARADTGAMSHVPAPAAPRTARETAAPSPPASQRRSNPPKPASPPDFAAPLAETKAWP